ncbi:hypothetical protein [Algoriphagus aquimarinus]|uniref:Uncharacterized protein n=1 Tax=Algoriphagus aquimarinus TaxID=237018 RepID=A0A5C7B0T3_9BACT|nr:hypothetical protein [Algoriphagus aquimarinus]TXE13399.1 hypothetical protein ESV85_05335 [Algoriphagus aquimarinus]
MTRTAFLLISTIIYLSLGNQIVFGQFKRLTISSNDTSALFIESYEVNFNKEKIYRKTPISNYLHIQGEKLKSKIRISKKDWKELESLLRRINLTEFENQISANSSENTFYLEFEKENNEIERFRFSKDQVPIEIENIWKEIKKITGANKM